MKAQGTVKGILVEGGDGQEYLLGFRPGSRDDAPMLGPSGIDRFVVATGHHRNGILLTPITAKTMSSYVLTGRVPEIVLPLPMSMPRFVLDAAEQLVTVQPLPAVMPLPVLRDATQLLTVPLSMETIPVAAF